MSRRPRVGVRRVGPDEQLTVVEHLDELRRRIILSVVALCVAFIAMYVVHDQLINLLMRPLPARYDNQKLLTLSPTEPLMLVLKVCFWSSILIALPIWLYQLYAFIVPAVGTQSRRRTLAVVGGVSSLFLAGVAFGFFVVLPVALRFLLNYADNVFTNDLRAGEYFGFATSMLLASGLLFELPVAMLALARLGLVSAAQFRHQWRLAIVIIAVIAALLPGGDPFSMLLLMAPQIALYALGIWLAGVFGQPPPWRREAWMAEADAGGG